MTKLFYRIGSAAEGGYFEEMKGCYYGVVINANLVALYTNWVPIFIQKLKKPFFVDPVTYVLAFDLENIKKNGDIKKSFEKLVNSYGQKIKNIIMGEERELLPEDFTENDKWKQDLIDEFVKKVFLFQKNVCSTQLQQTLSGILEIIGKKIQPEKSKLLFLIPPYFYFDSFDDSWYKISLHLAKTSVKFKGNYKICPIICTSKEFILNQENIHKLFEDYKEFDGYVLWVSDLNEREDDKKYLVGLCDLVKTFSASKKPIIMLYGEFFSLLLSKKYISGYVRNICYGEHKNAKAALVGGPLPRRRFYLNFTHSKIPESKVRTLFSSDPNLLCRCEICSKIKHKTIEEFFNNLKDIDFNKHFILVHYSEVNLAISELKELLVQNYLLCKKKEVENLGINYEHLEKWISILERWVR